jgi:hypothetical protein
MSEMPTPSFKKKFSSEFNAGSLEFSRLNEILVKIDALGSEVTIFERGAIFPYWASVKQLYTFLRPFLILNYSKAGLRKIEPQMHQLWLDCIDWNLAYINNKDAKGNQVEPYPLSLVKRIDDFLGNLLLIKQTIGFGIPLVKQESTKTTVRRYLNVGKSRDPRFERNI